MQAVTLSGALRTWLVLAVLPGMAAAQGIIPYPRPVVKSERLTGWTFQTDAAGWRAAHDSVLSATGGVLKITSSGDDPYLIGPPVQIDGPVAARLRLKCAAGGNGQIFWIEGTAQNFDETHSEHFHLIHDNQWHDYRVALATGGTIHRLRLDPAEGPGVIELESFQVMRETLHPLEIESVRTDGARVSARLKNFGAEAISFKMGGQPFALEAGATGEFSQMAPGEGLFRAHDLDIECAGLPAIHRVVSIIDADAAGDWAELRSRGLVVRAARDGTGARVEMGGRLVAVLAPLLSQDGVTPKLKLTSQGGALAWRGDGVALKLSLRGDEIIAKINSDRPCEGPVLRAFGRWNKGLFAGLEYLAKGEHSSSTLDIETDEHIRFAPDREKVTMPLMAFVTDRATDGNDLARHAVAAGLCHAQFSGRTGRPSRLATGNEHRMHDPASAHRGRWRMRSFGRYNGRVCRRCRRNRAPGRRNLTYV